MMMFPSFGVEFSLSHIAFKYIRKPNIFDIRLNKHSLTGDIKFYSSYT